ncbi:MAG TPA: hypothetical protein VNT75_12635, partial [Symbiobacteriaceae bacterium]|nr:hypothetical protein [Symbiobacteriaceae bacterium]
MLKRVRSAFSALLVFAMMFGLVLGGGAPRAQALAATVIQSPSDNGTLPESIVGTGETGATLSWEVTQADQTTPVDSGTTVVNGDGGWVVQLTDRQWYTSAPGGTEFTISVWNSEETAQKPTVHATKAVPVTHTSPVSFETPIQDGAPLKSTFSLLADPQANLNWAVEVNGTVAGSGSVATDAAGRATVSIGTEAWFTNLPESTALTLKARYPEAAQWVTRSVVKDTTPPTVSLTDPGTQAGSTVTLTYNLSEAGAVALTYGDPATPITQGQSQAGNGLTYNWTLPTAPGTTVQYTVKLVATDAAGNVSTPATATFTHAPPVPQVTVSVQENSGQPNDNAVEAGVATSLTFTANLPGVEFGYYNGTVPQTIGTTTAGALTVPYTWTPPAQGGMGDYFFWRIGNGDRTPIKMAAVPSGKAYVIYTVKDGPSQHFSTPTLVTAGNDYKTLTATLPNQAPVLNVVTAGVTYTGFSFFSEFDKVYGTQVTVSAAAHTVQRLDLDLSDSNRYATSNLTFKLDGVTAGGSVTLYGPSHSYTKSITGPVTLRLDKGLSMPAALLSPVGDTAYVIPATVTAGADTTVDFQKTAFATIALTNLQPSVTGELKAQLNPNWKTEATITAAKLAVLPTAGMPALAYHVDGWKYEFAPAFAQGGLAAQTYSFSYGGTYALNLAGPGSVAPGEVIALNATITDADGNQITKIWTPTGGGGMTTTSLVFTRNGTEIGRRSTAPFAVSEVRNTAGSYTYAASVTAGTWAGGTLSGEKTVTVNAPDVFVKIRENSGVPDDNGVLVGSVVPLTFEAKKADGSLLEGVEFFYEYNGSRTTLGTTSAQTPTVQYTWNAPAQSVVGNFFGYTYAGTETRVDVAVVPADSAIVKLTVRDMNGTYRVVSGDFTGPPVRPKAYLTSSTSGNPRAEVLEPGTYSGDIAFQDGSTVHVFSPTFTAAAGAFVQVNLDATAPDYVTRKVLVMLDGTPVSAGKQHLILSNGTQHLTANGSLDYRMQKDFAYPVVVEALATGKQAFKEVALNASYILQLNSTQMARISVTNQGTGTVMVQIRPDGPLVPVTRATLLLDPASKLPGFGYEKGEWRYEFTPASIPSAFTATDYSLTVGSALSLTLSGPTTAVAPGQNFTLSAEIADASGNKVTRVIRNVTEGTITHHVDMPVRFKLGTAEFGADFQAPYQASAAQQAEGTFTYSAAVDGDATLTDTVDVVVEAPQVDIKVLESSGAANDGIVERGTTVTLTFEAKDAAGAPLAGVTFGYKPAPQAEPTAIGTTTASSAQVTYEWAVPTGVDMPHFGYLYNGIWYYLPLMPVDGDSGVVELIVYDVNGTVMNVAGVFHRTDNEFSSYIESGHLSFVKAGTYTGVVGGLKDGVGYVLDAPLTVRPLEKALLEIRTNGTGYETRTITTTVDGNPAAGKVYVQDDRIGAFAFPTTGAVDIRLDTGRTAPVGTVVTAGGKTYYKADMLPASGNKTIAMTTGEMADLLVSSAGTGTMSMMVLGGARDVAIAAGHLLVASPVSFLYTQNNWEYHVNPAVFQGGTITPGNYTVTLGKPMSAVWTGPETVAENTPFVVGVALKDADNNKISAIDKPMTNGGMVRTGVTFKVDGVAVTDVMFGPQYTWSSNGLPAGSYTIEAVIDGGTYLANITPPVTRTLTVESGAGIAVTLSNDGVVPADGLNHNLTVTAKRGETAIEGAKVFIGTAEVGVTDANGQAVITLSGVENRIQPVRIRTTVGMEAETRAVVLQTGYGAVDFVATDRDGAPLPGYMNIFIGNDHKGSPGVDSQGKLLQILPAGSLEAEFTSHTGGPEEYYLAGYGTVTSQARIRVHFDGKASDLGLMTITPAAHLGHFEFNLTDPDLLRNTAWFEAPAAGDFKVWVKQNRWDVIHVYETEQAHYGLKVYGVNVTAAGAAVSLTETRLAHLDPTFDPNLTNGTLALQKGDFGVELRFPLSNKPIYVSSDWYVHTISFMAGTHRFSWWPTDGLDGYAGLLEAGKTYTFTVGGSLAAMLTLPATAEAGTTVKFDTRFGNEHGFIWPGGQPAVEVTAPDGRKFPAAWIGLTDWEFTPMQAGTYSLTATFAGVDPLATGAAKMVTRTITVSMPPFIVDGGFNGRGIARQYEIFGRLTEGVPATAVEYAVGSDTWSSATVDQFKHFRLSGALPDSLHAGDEVVVKVRLAGNAGSAKQFTAKVDETAPTLNTQYLTANMEGVMLAVDGYADDNLGPDNLSHIVIQYATGTPGTAPVWEELLTHTQWNRGSGNFRATAALPLGPSEYRVRISVKDVAGLASSWVEKTVTMPTSTVTATPSNRLLTVNASNVISLQVAISGAPVAGLSAELVDLSDDTKQDALTDTTGTVAFSVRPATAKSYQLILRAEGNILWEKSFFAPAAGQGGVDFQWRNAREGMEIDLFQVSDGLATPYNESWSYAPTLPAGQYVAAVTLGPTAGEPGYFMVKAFTVTAGAITTVTLDAGETLPISTDLTVMDGTAPVTLQQGTVRVRMLGPDTTPIFFTVPIGGSLKVFPGQYRLEYTAGNTVGDRFELVRTVTAGAAAGHTVQLSALAAIKNMALTPAGDPTLIRLYTEYTLEPNKVAPQKTFYTDPGQHELQYRFRRLVESGTTSTTYEYVFDAGTVQLVAGDNAATVGTLGGALQARFTVTPDQTVVGAQVGLHYELKNASGHLFLGTVVNPGETGAEWRDQATVVLEDSDGIAYPNSAEISLNDSTATATLPFDVAPGNYVVRASYDDNFYSPNASRLHTAEDTLVIRADMVVGAGI